MKIKLFSYLLLLVTVIGIGACSKSSTTPVDNTMLTFTATLTGASETPANNSTATGTATFTYNTVTYVLSGTLIYAGITPTGMHIHKGAVGTPGGVIFPLGAAPYSSPVSFTSPALDATQRADLMAGLYYVNIHSVTYGDGEIRGQLIKQTSTGGNGGGGY